MKNAFICAIFCFSFTMIMSCKKDPKSDKVELLEEVVDLTSIAEADVVEEKQPVVEKKKKKKKKPTKKDVTKAIAVPPGAPTFSSVEARKYIRNYESYIAKYKKAVEAKADMDSFLKLGEASSSLTSQYRKLVTKLSDNEIQKMSKYMNEKTKQIDALNDQM